MSEIQAVEGYTEQELASLSVEERAAISADIPEERLPSRIVDDANAGEVAREMQQQAKDQAAAKVVADAAIAAGAKASAEGKPAPVAAVVDPVAAVVDPVVAAPVVAPQDPFISKFQAKFIPDNEFEAAQGALAKQFEDGDLTTAQFMVQNGKLERAKIEGDIAFKQSEQSEGNLWQYQQDTWFAQLGNAVVRDDPRVWAAMQAQLETMYADPAKKGYSNLQFLEEAGVEVKRLFGLTVAPANAQVDKEPKKQAVIDAALPATLSAIPAADANEEKAEFDYLDKMDGMDYEIAVARMTKEQKDRFLAV
jgi:hypothetical protein